MLPPFTFAFAGSIPNSRIAYSGTQANASLIPTSRCRSTDNPALLNQTGTAWMGPTPISSGAQPYAQPLKMPKGSTPLLKPNPVHDHARRPRHLDS